MTNDSIQIREIQNKDNQRIAKVIREVLIEFGVPKVGTAYEDNALDMMFETYNIENAVYFVVEKNGKIIGGAGIKQLDNSNENICELQKMYFSEEARGLGIGKNMIDKCLEKAKTFGFEKCYLETMPYMEAARKLYRKNGFNNLEKPMGDTGHYSCSVWMIKDLND